MLCGSSSVAGVREVAVLVCCQLCVEWADDGVYGSVSIVAGSKGDDWLTSVVVLTSRFYTNDGTAGDE